jgi:hypothetical protein
MAPFPFFKKRRSLLYSLSVPDNLITEVDHDLAKQKNLNKKIFNPGINKESVGT